MFLAQIRKRNPGLIRAAVELHQSDAIPANTFVFDLDAISDNATALVREAERHELRSYLMTKQYGRNPFITAVALDRGFDGIVAVDMWSATLAHRYGGLVGHIGHLTQVPKRDVADAVAMRPEVITVFSERAAERISEVAARQSRAQDVLLRVRGERDIFFAGQEGGIDERDLDATVHRMSRLPGIRIVGVTSFPCLTYNLTADEPVRPTENLWTILRAADRLRSAHRIAVTQVNAPGNNSSSNYRLLAELGATHVEPGHALLGTTPSHAFTAGLPELPSYVYVTEVSHLLDDRALVIGGGFWVGARLEGNMASALVGSDLDGCMANEIPTLNSPDTIIDYYGVLEARGRCRVGDTAVYGFYSQIQMTHTHAAVVSGIQSGRPRLEGLFDPSGNLLDADGRPVEIDVARQRLDALRDRYRPPPGGEPAMLGRP
jgi:predicted amino acid racemase